MNALLIGALVLLAYMSVLFIVSLIRRDNGTADVGYGPAFVVLTSAVALSASFVYPLALLLLALVAVWAVRLSYRISRKNFGKPEDFRYKAWRDAWGKWFVVRSFFQVYLLQGLVVFAVSLPVTLALAYPSSTSMPLLVGTGVLLWILGFAFESIGDAQLDRFIGDPANKGRIMQSGLWKYSRHPNYFGESMMWWGLALASAGLTGFPWVVFASPVLITFLLLKVSGIPMLEKKWEGNPEWEEYKRKTSAFLPLPPRA